MHDADHFLSQQYHFKTNKHIIKRIVDKAFEEINSFSKLKLSSKFLNKKNRASDAKFDFQNFFNMKKKINVFFQSAVIGSQI